MKLFYRWLRLSAVFAFVLFTSSCDTDVVYDSFLHIPVDGWDKRDTLNFDVPKTKEDGLYRLEVNLRTTSTFPFTSITFVADQMTEPGHRLISDTLNCQLADDKGNVLGKGISLYQYKFILNDANLRRGDSLHISVRHIMKRETIPGISELGIKIRKR